MDRARGHDDVLAGHPQPPAGAGARLHGPGRAAAYLDALRARARVGGRAGRPGLGHVGDADVLLGAGRAAERAHARADAAAHVAVQEVARPAQRLHPAPDDRRVAPGQLGRHLHDVELALDAPEARLQLGLGRAPRGRVRRASGRARRPGVRKQVPELISVVPPTARPSGSRIGGRPSVATWPASRYSRAVISRGRAVNASVSCQLALLEQRHAHPALGQLLGRHRAAGAGADHAGVDRDRGVAVQVGAGDDPALRRVEGAGAVAVGGVAGRPHQRASAARSARQRAMTASAS